MLIEIIVRETGINPVKILVTPYSMRNIHVQYWSLLDLKTKPQCVVGSGRNVSWVPGILDFGYTLWVHKVNVSRGLFSQVNMYFPDNIFFFEVNR